MKTHSSFHSLGPTWDKTVQLSPRGVYWEALRPQWQMARWLVGRELTERRLAERHLVVWWLAERHLWQRPLAEQCLAEQPLAEQHLWQGTPRRHELWAFAPWRSWTRGSGRA